MLFTYSTSQDFLSRARIVARVQALLGEVRSKTVVDIEPKTTVLSFQANFIRNQHHIIIYYIYILLSTFVLHSAVQRIHTQ